MGPPFIDKIVYRYEIARKRHGEIASRPINPLYIHRLYRSRTTSEAECFIQPVRRARKSRPLSIDAPYTLCIRLYTTGLRNHWLRFQLEPPHPFLTYDSSNLINIFNCYIFNCYIYFFGMYIWETLTLFRLRCNNPLQTLNQCTNVTKWWVVTLFVKWGIFNVAVVANSSVLTLLVSYYIICSDRCHP